MPELLTYDFVVRAMIAGIVTAITAAIMGNFIVAARQAVISDMLAHAALAGVGIGIFIHASPSLFAGIIAIIASVLVWLMTQKQRRAPEAVAMLLLTGSLAVALLLAHAAKDNPVSFEPFLFGSILTITTAEVVLFSIVSAAIVLTLFVFFVKKK